jgi:hypothetical protein
MPSEETTTRSWLTQDQPAQLMAIDLRQKMLGCAFYSKDQGMFLLAEDQHESGPHYDLVRTLLSQIEPTTVIVNVGNDDKPLSGLLITYKEAFELLFVPSAEFSLTSALTRIQSLLKSTTAVNAVNECENLAGAKNCLSVGCVGALLKRISAEDLKLYHFQMYVGISFYVLWLIPHHK